MTVQEFKYWLQGFEEAIDERPTKKQWQKIKQKLKAVDGTSIVHQPVYVRDWWKPYQPYITWCDITATGLSDNVPHSLTAIGRWEAAGQNETALSLQ